MVLSADNNSNERSDEIKNYTDARYVSASEGCWRIFHFGMHEQKPATSRLPVHLKDNQVITFKETDSIDQLLINKSKTQLTEFFTLNSINFKARSLLYHQLPNHFNWDNKNKSWIEAKRFIIIKI